MSYAISRIKYFLDTYGDGGKQEINDICHAHVLTSTHQLNFPFHKKIFLLPSQCSPICSG